MLIRNTPSTLSTLCLTTSINSPLVLEQSPVDGWSRRLPSTAKAHKTKSKARDSKVRDTRHQPRLVMCGQGCRSGLEGTVGPPRSRRRRRESFPPGSWRSFWRSLSAEILSVPGKRPEWNFRHLQGSYQILKVACSDRNTALDCDKKQEPPVCSSVCLSVVLGSALGCETHICKLPW